MPSDMRSGGQGGMPLIAGGDIETTPGVGLEVVERERTSVAVLVDMRRVGDMLADRCCC